MSRERRITNALLALAALVLLWLCAESIAGPLFGRGGNAPTETVGNADGK